MFRKTTGEPVALQDRCPHRFAPLHMGKLQNGIVECGYHGLRFNSEGRCVHNPHGNGAIPKTAVVTSFPLVERNGYCWIWMGAREDVDVELIPDYGFLDNGPSTSLGRAYMHVPVHFEVMTDNIMDLSHADFVHGELLSTLGQLTASFPKIREVNNRLVVRLEWVQNPPQGFFAQFLEHPKAPANQWVEVGWDPASSMYLHVGAVQNGNSYDEGLIFWANHIMTPETESSTHYFYSGRRNWMVQDAELNRLFLEATVKAFKNEDTPMVTSVYQEMGAHDLLSLSPVLLSCDAGAIRVRRILSKMIAAEVAVRISTH